VAIEFASANSPFTRRWLMKMFILLLAVVSMAGCSAWSPWNSGPSKECRAIQGLVAKNVAAETTSVALLDFFKSQGWKSTYDKLDKAYVVEFPYGGLWKHVVVVKVWMKNDSTVDRYIVQDLYTSL
jgi:hypothetical protein